MLAFGAVARNAHGGPVFGGEFPGDGKLPRIDRNWERRESPGHWLQTPWRRRDASQLLAKHILSRRISVPRAPSFFMATVAGSSSRRSPIKSRLLLAWRPEISRSLPLRCSPLLFLFGGNTIVLIVETFSDTGKSSNVISLQYNPHYSSVLFDYYARKMKKK